MDLFVQVNAFSVTHQDTYNGFQKQEYQALHIYLNKNDLGKILIKTMKCQKDQD